jgi:hypothetical protein
MRLTEVVIFLRVPKLRVLFAAEGTFGGGILRGPNIQPIATTLIC